MAAVIAERGLVRERSRLPRGGLRAALVSLLAPLVEVVAFVLLFTAAVLVGGEVLGIAARGGLATTPAEVMRGAATLLGQAAVDDAGPAPLVPVLLLASIWGALVGGWTVNGLVAMGEEYGWRGLMWDTLARRGVVRANIAIGLAWGCGTPPSSCRATTSRVTPPAHHGTARTGRGGAAPSSGRRAPARPPPSPGGAQARPRP